VSDRFRNSIVLTGPTGSGKSGIALELADRLGAEIVAMDSMTLYRGLEIGTAKPSAAERRRVAHHLIDVLDPWESASVAWWIDHAAECVIDIERRGRRALFVGGTPLYLKALLFGLFEGPAADRDIRRRLEAEAEPDGGASLHARLAGVDPLAAQRLHVNDVRRIIRALEVWELTGRPISELQREWRRSIDPASGPAVYCIDRPREELYQRIDRRVVQMLEAGWLDEVRRLRELPRPPSREVLSAIGYKELMIYLDGKQCWETTVAGIQQRTRNLAKRQLTWFRHLPGCRFVPPQLTSWPHDSKMNGP
jgi:tRNA dimethylallyltransferase